MSSTSPVWGILAALMAAGIIIVAAVYAIGDVSARHTEAQAAIEQARASIAQANVEIVRAHESGSTERMQVFALTLRSFSADNRTEMTLLSVGVIILAVLQLVQAVTKGR